MQYVISTERIPIKMWLSTIEDDALKQAQNLANLPFAFKHICLMPDAHVGFGMPIGGVMASKDVIVPNAVGVDIGCGMCAIKTNLKKSQIETDSMKTMLSRIRERIPLGFDHHKERQAESLMPQGHDIESMKIVKQEYFAAMKQLGTLGGGNHFIEIQSDATQGIWIMLHSGSRNIGAKVAEYYNQQAKKLNQMYFTSVNPKFDLAFLPFDSELGHKYYKEMRYCIDFAYANRKLMMDRIIEVFRDVFPEFEHDELINIAHNYAAWETHYNEKVIVHRKGATSAKAGETGIIPGSQGTSSYIVEGLGNPESFTSCSHGAGRVMSRTQAKNNLNLEEEIKKLNQKGIIHSIRGKHDLEEAASAYKDIDEVMQNQQDLVKIVHKLEPFAVIKG